MTYTWREVGRPQHVWTFVWCGVCNTDVVILGRRWLHHTDPRPECIMCTIKRIWAELGLGVLGHV